jgi:4-amino-4-deoxy-L-arabinose transferase-like glycosyltransferase
MKKRLPLLLLIAIILLAAFLRLYRISDYMTFLGDEGRDVLVAKGILEGDFTLLGPRASAGDFFLGPAYYYMMAPWLWLFRYDPVGPAVMVALFGVATVFLIYLAGKKWFNERAGLIAAALYSVAPVIVTYSHSSWNPNVVPFFSLLTIYLLYLAFKAKKPTKYFLVIGLLLGIGLQLHYLVLFLMIIVFLYTAIADWYVAKKVKIFSILSNYLKILLGFFVGFSPFLAFEIRHGFPNITTISRFIFTDTFQKSAEANIPFSTIITDVFFRVFARLVFYYPSPDLFFTFSQLHLQVLGWFAMIVSFTAIGVMFFHKNKLAVILAALWLFVGIFLFGFYKKAIYDYYFVFLFPIPFLIVGNLLSQIPTWSKHKIKKLLLLALAVIIFISTFAYNLTGMPFRHVPNRQKNQAKIISEAVIKQANNKPYNFALISKGNSDQEYRYYLEILGKPPVTIENPINDPDRKSVTDQLLIVCEDVACKPLGYSLFEVAGFGRAEIAGQWDVSVVKVYRLVPYKEKNTDK